MEPPEPPGMAKQDCMDAIHHLKFEEFGLYHIDHVSLIAVRAASKLFTAKRSRVVQKKLKFFPRMIFTPQPSSNIVS
jgi:hypothetical protein